MEFVLETDSEKSFYYITFTLFLFKWIKIPEPVSQATSKTYLQAPPELKKF